MLVLTGISLISGLVFMGLFPLIPAGIDEIIIIPCLIIMHCIMLSSLIRPISVVSLIKPILRIDTLFYLFFYLLFVLPYVAYYFGLAELQQNKFIDNLFIEHTNRAVVASAIGLCFFSAGFRYFENKVVHGFNNQLSETPEPIDLNESYFADKALNISIVGWLLMLILFALTGAASQMVGQYTGLGAQEATMDGVYYLMIHFSMMIMAFGVAVIILEANISINTVIKLLPAIVWSILLLVSGDRNSFLLIAIIPIVGFSTYLINVKPWVWPIVFVLAFSIYQAVEISRSQGDRNISDLLNVLFVDDKTPESNVVDSSFSLTTITSRASFAEEPNGDPISYGKFKLIGFMGVVPYSRGLFFNSEMEDVTSADYISQIILGQFRTWSIGTNIISDIVIDGGVLLLPLFMTMAGTFGGYVYLMAKSFVTTTTISLYLFTLAFYCEYPRYAYDFPVRGIVWLLVFLWLLKNMLKTIAIKRTTSF